jgi:hypothetical protein
VHISIDSSLEYLRPYAEHICALLGLEHVEIVASQYSYAERTSPRIGLSEREALEKSRTPLVCILAHELRHLWQYASGRAVYHPSLGGSTWDGNLVAEHFFPSAAEYYALPWERDANQWAAEYVLRFAPDLLSADDWVRYYAERLPDLAPPQTTLRVA